MNRKSTGNSGLFAPSLESGESIDERRRLLERIAQSPQFRRAPKLRDFLTYVVEQTLSAPTEPLNEQQIGRAVFGRAADYSPSEDNVVRAHARQLRLKLGDYFTTTGKDEPLVLEIPKGTYIPEFAPRAIESYIPAAEPPPTVEPARTSRWVAMVLITFLFGICLLLAMQNRALQRQVAASLAGGPPLPAPLAWVFDPDRSASLVVADSCFGLLQDLAGRPAQLDEYVDPEFWKTVPPSSLNTNESRLMRRIRSRELTSYADILLTARLMRLADARAKVNIRFARDLRPRELNSGNFVFLGSSYSNPWVALYDQKRNFKIQVDATAKQSTVINKKPRAGERASYLMMGEDRMPGATYGLIAFFPSDGVTGNVLIIEGTNMEGTEAAGSMILDPKSSRALLAMAAIPETGRTHPFFEVLLETKALAGAPSQTRVIAWRN